MIPFLDIGLKIVDKLIPDPAQKAAAQLEVLKLNQAGEFKDIETELAMTQQQTDINKIEAASPSFFKSGWRPATGWVCVLGLAYQFLFRPIFGWVSGNMGWTAPPSLEIQTLLTLLGGLLGLGTMRHLERMADKT